MRERLARRHAKHVGADRTPEQSPETVDRALRLGEEHLELVEPFAMFAVHRIEPRVQPGERVAMPGQDEQIVGQLLEPRDRIEPFAEWVGSGLGHAERDVRADPRQHLVARDQHLGCRIVEASMFGAVSRSDDDLPLGLPDPQRVAMLDPRVAERQRRHDPAKPCPAAFARMRDLRIVPSSAAPEGEHLVGHRVARVGHQHPRGEPLAARHHERAAMLVAHPAGEPDMVGVEMRTDHLRHANAGERPFRQRLPGIARLGRVHPRIDQRNAAIVIEQPAIDVLERPGNVQSDPANAGCHWHHVVRVRLGAAERIGQPLVAGRGERGGDGCGGHGTG